MKNEFFFGFLFSKLALKNWNNFHIFLEFFSCEFPWKDHFFTKCIKNSTLKSSSKVSHDIVLLQLLHAIPQRWSSLVERKNLWFLSSAQELRICALFLALTCSHCEELFAQQRKVLAYSTHKCPDFHVAKEIWARMLVSCHGEYFAIQHKPFCQKHSSPSASTLENYKTLGKKLSSDLTWARLIPQAVLCNRFQQNKFVPANNSFNYIICKRTTNSSTQCRNSQRGNKNENEK